jgi:hypothetical protein
MTTFIIQDTQGCFPPKPGYNNVWELHRKGCKDTVKNAIRYRMETVAMGSTIQLALDNLLDGELREELGYGEESVDLKPCAIKADKS